MIISGTFFPLFLPQFLDTLLIDKKKHYFIGSGSDGITKTVKNARTKLLDSFAQKNCCCCLNRFCFFWASSRYIQLSWRACLHGDGGPQIGEVTCGGSPHLSGKRDQIKMRDYVDRRVTHQSGLPHLPGVPHLHVKQALTYFIWNTLINTSVKMRDHFLIKIRIHSEVFIYDLFYILIAFLKCFVVYILT